MMKREREDGLERSEGLSNGNKIQRVAGHTTDRTAEDSRSQDVVRSLDRPTQVRPVIQPTPGCKVTTL